MSVTIHPTACKKGGLLTLGRNEIRDTVGDLASLVWKDVQREPVISEYNPQDETPALIADLFCRGVYVRQGGASFDIRVSDTDAISYQNRSSMSVLHSVEVEKKTKYSDACQERHMPFTPLVVSVDGMLAPEIANFLRRIGEALSTKWEKPYSKTMNWGKCRLSFAVLRASSVCFRGTRTKWRSLGSDHDLLLKRNINGCSTMKRNWLAMCKLC